MFIQIIFVSVYLYFCVRDVEPEKQIELDTCNIVCYEQTTRQQLYMFQAI